jgi:hypothetical protein
MKYSRFIGIDPGAKGAIASLDANGEFVSVIDMPDDFLSLYTVIADLSPKLVSMETAVAAIECPSQPNDGRSVASAQELGRWMGACQMALTAHGVGCFLPRPQVWKRGVFWAERKRIIRPFDKAACRSLATMIFGTACLGRRKTEDRSEALLIARWLYHEMAK